MSKSKAIFNTMIIGILFSIPLFACFSQANDCSETVTCTTLEPVGFFIDGSTDMETSLDVLTFEGTPAAIGGKYGLQFRDSIQLNVKNHWESILKTGLSPLEVLKIVEVREKYLSPDIVEELKAMAVAAQVSYIDLLVYNLFTQFQQPEEESGCTSWVAAGTGSRTGETLLHKNRDFAFKPQVAIQINREGKYKYMALISEGQTTLLPAGINEHGLAVIQNDVGMNLMNYNVFGIEGTEMCRYIIENCRNVDEAIAYVANANNFGGSIIFLADKDKGAIIELTGWQQHVEIIENEAQFRSNHFLNLTDKTYASPAHSTTSSRRYEAAKEFFEEKSYNLSVLDCHELSRHHYYSEDGVLSAHDSADGSICNHRTLFGVTFQIDKDYPGELSTMWTAIGFPCSSIYVPLHVGATEIQEAYKNGVAWRAAVEIKSMNLGPHAGLIPHFLDIEQEFINNETIVREEARIQFDDNNDTDAREIVTNFDLSSCSDAFNEMEQIANVTFWIDSFYNNYHIGSSVNVTIDNNVTLQAGKKMGTFDSESITTVLRGWEDAIFYANHTLIPGTNITYEVLDSNNNQVLFNVTAQEAEDGVNISARLGNPDITSIILRAKLTSNNSANTPVLEEWGILGLLSTGSPASGLSTLDIVIICAIIGLVGICTAIIIRRQLYIKKNPRAKDNVKVKSRAASEEISGSKPASSIARIGAWFIDAVLIISLWIIAYLACLIPVFFNPFHVTIGYELTIGIGLSFIFLTGFFYFWILESLNKGQSIGKMIFRLKTVDSGTLGPLTKGKHAINSTLKGSPLIIFDIAIGLIKNVARPEKQYRITQNLSNVIVVKVEREKTLKRRNIIAFFIFFVVILVIEMMIAYLIIWNLLGYL